MNTRDHARNLALKLQGVPYIWGGSNPWQGFDCSGFVCWVLQVFDVLPSGRMNAQGLFDYFWGREPPNGRTKDTGDLCFYGADAQHVTHVMLALDNELCVGASGGVQTTTTIQEAVRLGAQVKVKPILYRKDLIHVVRVPWPGDVMRLISETVAPGKG